MPLLNIRTRAMLAGDLDEVVAIEAESYDFPWSMGIFCDCLRVGYHCRVLLLDERIVGYGIVSTLSCEAHILNLCISREVRRLGLGRELLHGLLGIAAERGIDEVFLEVRPSNRAALALYRSFGFERVGVRHNYYRADAGREDAYVMCAHVAGMNAADRFLPQSGALH